VIGATMQIWQDEERQIQEENGGCCGQSAVEDARRVAQQLEIPHYVMNFKEEFKDRVIDYFVEEDGSIHSYDPKEYNLDNVNAGKTLFDLYELTGKEKYRKAKYPVPAANSSAGRIAAGEHRIRRKAAGYGKKYICYSSFLQALFQTAWFCFL